MLEPPTENCNDQQVTDHCCITCAQLPVTVAFSLYCWSLAFLLKYNPVNFALYTTKVHDERKGLYQQGNFYYVVYGTNTMQK